MANDSLNTHKSLSASIGGPADSTTFWCPAQASLAKPREINGSMQCAMFLALETAAVFCCLRAAWIPLQHLSISKESSPEIAGLVFSLCLHQPAWQENVWGGVIHGLDHVMADSGQPIHVHSLSLSLSLRAGGPGFESRLRPDFFGVESYQWLQNWHSSGYPARRLAL